ncbi:MAG TPA: alpha/beta hydrolase [Ktedonobacteraceae bacterium]|nr:alpha/beta hydrolase [Ktedonobacteraceae bacterium]
MPLDPQVALLIQAEANTPEMYTLSVEDARQQVLLSVAALKGEKEPIKSVENHEIPGPGGVIPVRIYTPEGEVPLPILVYFHGGGWVLCNLDTHDSICRGLANLVGCIVVSVDYRLAPEHKYPAAVEDCYAATCWVAQNAAAIGGDATRLAVGGDSAGGNLTAVVNLIARDEGGPSISFQLLIYPVTDYHTPGTPSYIENQEGYLLSREDMIWYFGHYLSSPDEAQDPHVSPLKASDLSNLPSAMVITAEFDLLRDEGEAFAQRLQEAGVPVILKRYNGLIHGLFGKDDGIDQAIQAQIDAANVLREAFSRKGM